MRSKYNYLHTYTQCVPVLSKLNSTPISNHVHKLHTSHFKYYTLLSDPGDIWHNGKQGVNMSNFRSFHKLRLVLEGLTGSLVIAKKHCLISGKEHQSTKSMLDTPREYCQTH